MCVLVRALHPARVNSSPPGARQTLCSHHVLHVRRFVWCRIVRTCFSYCVLHVRHVHSLLSHVCVFYTGTGTNWLPHLRVKVKGMFPLFPLILICSIIFTTANTVTVTLTRKLEQKTTCNGPPLDPYPPTPGRVRAGGAYITHGGAHNAQRARGLRKYRLTCPPSREVNRSVMWV